MRKGRRSAETLSYLPELGSRALTRRKQGMPRSVAVNNKCFLATAEVVSAACTTRSPFIP
jgi:hypothetical protein